MRVRLGGEQIKTNSNFEKKKMGRKESNKWATTRRRLIWFLSQVEEKTKKRENQHQNNAIARAEETLTFPAKTNGKITI